MNKDNIRILSFANAACDAVILVVCYMLSSFVRLGSFTELGSIYWNKWPGYTVLIVVIYALVIVALYGMTRVYDYTYKGRLNRVVALVTFVNTIGILCLTAILYLGHFEHVSRFALLCFYVLSNVFVIAVHYAITMLLRSRRKSGRFSKKVVIVGTGLVAQRFAQAVEADDMRYERIVGFVGEKGSEDQAIDSYLGGVDALEDVLQEKDVNEIVIALEAEHQQQIFSVLALCDKYGTGLKIVPFYNDVLPDYPALDSIGGIKTMNARSIPLDNYMSAFIKRALDIIVSLLVILLTSPILLVSAIGVKASSPGPVVFSQLRTGKNGKIFKMYKFRSMRLASGDVSTFTEDKEERKTKFGSFIRKYSIDELPQFFNVLFGDMSIVGPRPVVSEETDVYRNVIPLYMLRHQVRPGITGLAQVNGFRGGTDLDDIEQRTKFDLEYIKHWTLWLDVKLFFRTLFGGYISGE